MVQQSIEMKFTLIQFLPEENNISQNHPTRTKRRTSSSKSIIVPLDPVLSSVPSQRTTTTIMEQCHSPNGSICFCSSFPIDGRQVPSSTTTSRSDSNNNHMRTCLNPSFSVFHEISFHGGVFMESQMTVPIIAQKAPHPTRKVQKQRKMSNPKHSERNNMSFSETMSCHVPTTMVTTGEHSRIEGQVKQCPTRPVRYSISIKELLN